MVRYRKYVALCFTVILLMLTVACGETPSPSAPSSSTEGLGTSQQSTEGAEQGSFPRTITHEKGTTVLKSRPQKIAITYFPYAEHLFAIGEQGAVGGVVGLKSLQNFKVYDSFTKDGRIMDLGDTMNLEAILALEPDVIIGWNEDDKMYDQLSKIADTIIIPQSENWQDTITRVAEVIGEEQKAEVYIQNYNAKLEKTAAKIDQNGEKGKQAVFLMTWNKGFYYYGGVRMEPYYNKLGFAKFEGMQDWGELSLENLSKIDPDYIFLGLDFTNSAELSLEQLEKSAVWNSLKAVKNGHMFLVDTEIVGPLAMGQSKGLDVIQSIVEQQ